MALGKLWLTFSISVLAASACLATGGELDKGFGRQGRATVHIGFSQPVGNSVSIDQMDRTYVLTATSSGNITIVRLMVDGLVDLNYGADGMFTDFDSSLGNQPGQNTYDFIKSLTLKDGTIYVLRSKYLWSNTDGRVVGSDLLRINPAGRLDASFNGSGRLYLDDVGSSSLIGGALAADSSGISIFFTENLCHVNLNGTVEATFGTNGCTKVTYPQNFGPVSVASSLEPGFIASGSLKGPGDEFVPAAVRINSDGTLDKSFGQNGIWSGTENKMAARFVQILPSGIYLSVYQFYKGVERENHLTRLTPSGATDPSFDKYGLLEKYLGVENYGKFIVENNDHSLLLDIGYEIPPNGYMNGVAKLTPPGDVINDGSTFGTFGEVFDPFPKSDNGILGIVVQKSGKVLVVNSKTGGGNSISLYRLTQ